MARKLAIAGAAVAITLLVIVILLFIIPNEARVALRDIAIIFMVVLGIVGTLLTTLLVAALVIITIMIKDKIIPMLEQLTETAQRVRGTTSFVSDEVVQPIISAAGTIAKVRAMTRTALGRDQSKS